MRPLLRLLTDELCEKIVNEAYAILHDQGINLLHNRILELLAGRGCRVDMAKQRVRFDREIIDDCIASSPREVRLWNIAGDKYFSLGGMNVHFTPGSTCIKVLDHVGGRMGTAGVDDMLAYCRLVEQLDGIDYPSTAIVPGDVPEAIGDSIRLYGLLKTGSRPIVTGAFTVAGFDVMRDLMLVVRRSSGTLREKPFAVFSCCPTSPLKWSGTTSDNAMKCAELGVPVEFVPMPTAGLVAPVSVLGCVIQHAAEAISGVVLSQTVNPGAPVLYGVSPGVFDMRSMGATVCAVESQMIACACNEVGKYLGLPTQAYIGSSDSKLLDAQSGFESGTGLYLAALSGVNSVSGPGMTDFQTAISLEKLFVDSEMCRIAKRLAAGIEIREDLPAGPLMEELLREGNLLTSDHTLRYFRQEHYMPGPAIDRGQMKAVNAINPDTAERAHVEVLRRLSEYKPPAVLDRGQQAELDRIMRSAAGAFDFDPVSRRFAV